METPDILRLIPAESLNPQYYFPSLVEKAMARGLLTAGDLSKMQLELLAILAQQAEQWSRGESSSIPVEKARDLMDSVLFVIGIQLKACRAPEQAVDRLKSEPLQALFEGGIKLVGRKMARARHLQKQIAGHLLDTPNVYYRATIVDGINGFFRLYRPWFAAHEIHITADYPVLAGRPKLMGIEFIEAYLRCVEVENAFCLCFDPGKIHQLLRGLTPDYPSVPLNLFEPVLLSALGLVMVHRHPAGLDLDEDDLCRLYQQFSGETEHGIRDRLKVAFSLLENTMPLPRGTRRYAFLCIPGIAAAIQNAVKMKTLDHVFLLPALPEGESGITPVYGDRMEDRKYRNLVEQILRTDSGEEKAALILREVHTLGDLLEILADGELGEEELELVINRLPPAVFAALLVQIPSDDFLREEHETLLYRALQKRKQRLSPEEARQLF